MEGRKVHGSREISVAAQIPRPHPPAIFAVKTCHQNQLLSQRLGLRCGGGHRQFMEPEPNKKDAKCSSGQAMFMGVGSGIALGAGVGVAIHNLAMGVGIGTALGALIGAVLQYKKCKK